MFVNTGEFPLLNVDVLKLSDIEKNKLRTRLKAETEDICSSFGGLVSLIERKLQASDVTIEHLQTFFEHSEYPEMAKLICKTDTIHTVINKVKREGYWSFFNYDLLKKFVMYHFDEKSVIICKMNTYISKFTRYCQRKMSEVPAEVFNGDEPTAKICKVKLDDKFCVSSPMCDILMMQNKIGKILNREDILLVGVDEGCIQLTLKYFKDISTNEIEECAAKLKEIGVQSLLVTFCGEYILMRSGCKNQGVTRNTSPPPPLSIMWIW